MDFSFAHKHIAKLYSDTCCVIEKQSVEEGNFTYADREVQVYTDIPCHVSHNVNKPAAQVGSTVAFSPSLTSKMSLSPDYIIKAGSKIIVTRAGQSTTYRCSGKPRVYTSHQEIALELDDDKT